MVLMINNISKSYGTNIALNNLTATLDAGIYALLGPNGSGKSTLMNILTDNLKADSGEILYEDANSVRENVLDMGVRFREKLGFMP
ncbi:MAG: ATP-binding cassette domain-containing protein, partial [Oscillospiraceae bacterium]|nr:ATP-binding cassette domain-containing protein [Oscillospiraceae bacterium]